MLLENGADVNMLSYCNTYCSYESPVVTASRLHNVDLVRIFLKHRCALENDPASVYKEGQFGEFLLAQDIEIIIICEKTCFFLKYDGCESLVVFISVKFH